MAKCKTEPGDDVARPGMVLVMRYMKPTGGFCRADTPGARALYFWMRRKVRTGDVPERKQHFAKTLAQSGNINATVRATGESFGEIYRWRRDDAQFAADWELARAAGYARLEEMTMRRLVEGTEMTTRIADDGATVRHSYDMSTAARMIIAFRAEKGGAAVPSSGFWTPWTREEIDRRLADKLAPYGVTLRPAGK